MHVSQSSCLFNGTLKDQQPIRTSDESYQTMHSIKFDVTPYCGGADLGASQLHVRGVHLTPQQLIQCCIACQDDGLIRALYAPAATELLFSQMPS